PGTLVGRFVVRPGWPPRPDAAVRVNIRPIPFENRRTGKVLQDAVHLRVLLFFDSLLGLLW
ncbi:hypothetical protein ACFVJI_22395, partial [Streptomyces sp. NPDC127584]|uniref:hypothetical protein n=1 Tax=Streptomyces sp. NPDC127584 TaxID=3345403 RepID=UPI00362BA487